MITTKQLKCGCAFTYDDDENNEITSFAMCAFHLRNNQVVIKELLDKSIEYENKKNKKGTYNKGKRK